MASRWDNLHFIINENGQVVGDFERGDGSYGFLRDRKHFTFNEATKDERSLLVHLVYLFFTIGDTQYHEGYEYVELEGYMLYRKVKQVTFYKNMFFKSRLLPDAQYLYLSIKDDLNSDYYVLTTSDIGFADALSAHFDKNYNMSLDRELIHADTSEELDYWDQNLTIISR